MNLNVGILIIALTAGAYAQSPATNAAKKTAPAPAKAAVSKPAAPKSAAAAQAKPSVAQAKPAVAHAPAIKAKAAAPKQEAEKKPSEPKAEVNTASSVNAPVPGARKTAGKRDPFVSPVSDRNNEPVNCGSGKRCLVPDQTALRGVVRAPSGMIAVVTNPQEKAYFLRENDPVYNGYVLRITPNSVVFRETVEDRLGRKSTREVVKKVNAPVV